MKPRQGEWLKGKVERLVNNLKEPASDVRSRHGGCMQTVTKPARLEQNLGWIALLLLLIGCLLVLRPFASALLWAVVLCVSSWPLYQRLLKLLRGRRTWAALFMALGMILIMLLPFVVVGLTLADNVKELTIAAQTWLGAGPHGAPGWLATGPTA